MRHFLNPLTITAGEICFHGVLIHGTAVLHKTSLLSELVPEHGCLPRAVQNTVVANEHWEAYSLEHVVMRLSSMYDHSVFIHYLIIIIHGAEPLRSHQLWSYSGTSQHFMEHKGSLPYSQEPSTGPYPEPDCSSPYNPILSPSYPF
jgi:hypothetical protein